MTSRRRWLASIARVAFVVLVIAAVAWSLRGDLHEAGAAMASVPGWRLAISCLLMGGGVLMTAMVWTRLLGSFGHDIPSTSARAAFFVGQIGKYLPGSVWSIGIQAVLTRRHAVPTRTTVTVSLLFLGVHVVSGLAVGGALLAATELDVAPVWGWVVAVPAMAGLLPVTIRRIASILNPGGAIMWTTRSSLAALVVMSTVWGLYGSSLALLLPDPHARDAVTMMVAFCAAHAAGVAIPLAPAGAGAREGVLLLLLAPIYGIGPAAAVALLARLSNLLADFGIAAATWWRDVRGSATTSASVRT